MQGVQPLRLRGCNVVVVSDAVLFARLAAICAGLTCALDVPAILEVCELALDSLAGDAQRLA